MQGPVPVTFKYQHPRYSQVPPNMLPPVVRKPLSFLYTDDDAHQLMAQALTVLGSKWTGRVEDAYDLARRICSHPNDWSQQSGSGSGGMNGGSGQQRAMGPIQSTLDLESSLLRILDLIDLDDSPHSPRYNLRQYTGHTMLHYAAGLGYTRLVAGLLARGADPSLRDKNGMTPMHLASLNGHIQIVRKLKRAGADPMTRSLRGFKASDLATTIEMMQELNIGRVRSWSGNIRNMRPLSRQSSTSSLQSFWDASLASHYSGGYSTDAADLSDDETQDLDTGIERAISAADPSLYMGPSRRNSQAVHNTVPTGNLSGPMEEQSSADASMAWQQWRDQFMNLVQQYQQNAAHWRFPSMPVLPPMGLPDYQDNPFVRRISSLVPHRASNSRPATASEQKDGEKAKDYGWMELLTGPRVPTSPTMQPPSYEEIYPGQAETRDMDIKKSSAVQAAAEAAIDQHFAAQSSAPAESSSSAVPKTNDIQILRKTLSKEDQDQLRAEYSQKMKKISSDRKLFFVWVSDTLNCGLLVVRERLLILIQIPILLVLFILVFRTWVPYVAAGASMAYGAVKRAPEIKERIVELLA